MLLSERQRVSVQSVVDVQLMGELRHPWLIRGVSATCLVTIVTCDPDGGMHGGKGHGGGPSNVIPPPSELGAFPSFFPELDCICFVFALQDCVLQGCYEGIEPRHLVISYDHC